MTLAKLFAHCALLAMFYTCWGCLLFWHIKIHFYSNFSFCRLFLSWNNMNSFGNVLLYVSSDLSGANHRPKCSGKLFVDADTKHGRIAIFEINHFENDEILKVYYFRFVSWRFVVKTDSFAQNSGTDFFWYNSKASMYKFWAFFSVKTLDLSVLHICIWVYFKVPSCQPIQRFRLSIFYILPSLHSYTFIKKPIIRLRPSHRLRNKLVHIYADTQDFCDTHEPRPTPVFWRI